MTELRRLIAKAGPVVALVAILAVAAWLRLGNVGENPAWFADEGSNVEVARRLQDGRMEYMALGESTLMVSRLILFEGLLAGALRIFGGGIGTLRAMTGVMGVVTVGVVFVVTRRIGGRNVPALLAAGLLAIYPQAILMSRFGFSYNLLAPLVMIEMWCLWEYTRSGRRLWLAGAAAVIGLGTLSDLWMLAMFAPLALIVGLRRWRDLAWSVPLAALPFGLYLGFLLIRAPEAAAMDIGFVLLRVSGLTIGEQIWNVALNFTVLLSQDFWMPCAVIGLMVMEGAEARRVAMLIFFVPLAVIGRTVALHGLSAHYMIPLLPLVAFGAAVLIERGLSTVQNQPRGDSPPDGGHTPTHEGVGCVYSSLYEVISQKTLTRGEWPRSASPGLIVAVPLCVSLALGFEHVQSGFPTAIDPFLTEPGDAREVAEFINANTSKNDLVIVSPSISWLIDARTADVQMAIAAEGIRTVHYPEGIPPERWAYDPRIEKARYVVVDQFWRGWGIANVDGLAGIMEMIEAWPVVFETGSIQVYQNPAAP